MEKEFVSYEQSVAVRELGFKEKCIATVENNGYVHIKGTRGLPSAAAVVDKVDAPLKQQVFRWFREKYGYIFPISDGLTRVFVGRFIWMDGEYESYFTKDFKTYEEAENACIDKLIEIAKQQSNTDDTLSKQQDK